MSTIPERPTDWYRSATRWTQLTLVEDDPASLDLDFWTGVMRDTRSNAACLSAGGYVAYYPTRIPYHHRSRHLGDGDAFGDLVDCARSLGMSVTARVDPHAVHADAARDHPEWLSLLPDGTPQQHPGFDDAWITCPFGDYNREFLTEVAREVVRGYDVDAVFANRWTGHGISYSESARRQFFDATRYRLPVRQGDLDDPAWIAYAGWRREKFSELVRLWDDAVRDVKPHVRFIPSLGGEFGPSYFDRSFIEKHYPFFILDKQSRIGLEVPWAAGRVGKRNRAIFRDRPVVLVTSVGPESRHRWKDSVQSGPELQTWIVDGFAQGASPWFTKFNAKVPDGRWRAPVIDAFGLHARVEPVLSTMRIVADVALFETSRPVRSELGMPDPYDHENGVYQALVEARIPFEFVSDTAVTADDLARFRVVVLANAERLTDDQCATIRAYVAAGGALVAAHETSLLDEAGAFRGDFGLADVFGAHAHGRAGAPVRNTYVAITAEHPVTSRYGGASRIIGGTRSVPVTAEAHAEVIFRFVPPFPDIPMEEVYPRSVPTEPAVVLNAFGAGRSAYVAFDLGSVFWEELQPDHGTLIAELVRWALGEPDRVTVNGAGLFDVATWESAGAFAVAIVNLTNPMSMRGPLREVIPSSPLRVGIRVPDGRVPARVELLVGENVAQWSLEDGVAIVTIPRLDVLETIHLVWGARSPDGAGAGAAGDPRTKDD